MMETAPEIPQTCPRVGKSPGLGRLWRRDFVSRTLADVTGAMQEAVFAEEYARKRGFLQSLDPRVKVVTFLALLLAVAFARNPMVLAALYLLTLALAAASRISIRFFVKRVWLFVPIFAGVVALPAIFGFVTPGKPLLVLAPGIAITQQGLHGAEIFVLRVATSVSVAVLLVLTTEWHRLLKALSAIGFPEIGVLVLGMTYRYIFLFLRSVEAMFLSRRSRTVGRTPLREKHSWLGASIGALLGRSYHMSEEVHLAMLSRGWRAKPSGAERFSISAADWAWGAAVFLLVILSVVVGHI